MRIGLPVPDYMGLGKGGGVETYSIKLVEYLQKIDKQNEYLIFCNRDNEDMFTLRSRSFRKILKEDEDRSGPAETATGAAKNIMFGISSLMERNAVLRRIKNGIRDVILRNSPVSADNPHRCDLIHHMYTVFPFWLNYDVPVIVTMVDIQHEYFPDFFSQKEFEDRRACYKPSADKADHIIAISHFTKKTLMEKFDLPDEKISVVHLGYDQQTFMKLDPASVGTIRMKYSLPDSFLFYPAASWPHKNHINLVRAYKILKGKYNFGDKLILCGIEKQQHTEIGDEIRKLGLQDDILYLGYVPYSDLPAIFNAATLMVYPSFFEGFGIPLIEAMAVGLPVACSGTTSLPEVGGDAVLYFDPNEPEDIAARVYLPYSDPDLRNSLVNRGYERIKGFTWEKTTRETLRIYGDVYRNYAGGHN